MAQALVEEQLAKLVGHAQDRLERLRDQLDTALASGEVDAVHGTRVASRRLNETLAVMQPWLDRDDVRLARRGLRSLRNAFRKVRDLDVLQMSLAQTPPDLDPGRLAELEGLLTRRRECTLAAALRKARRAAPQRSIRLVGRLIRQFNRAYDPRGRTISDHLAEQFQALAGVVLEHDPRRSESADLHFIRIRVKRTRYCAELANRVGPACDEGLVQQLTSMQDRTGRWNDHLAAARVLTRIARRRRMLAEQTVGSLRLLEYTARRLSAAEAERAQILEHWPAFEAAIRGTVWYRRSDVPVEQVQPAPAA